MKSKAICQGGVVVRVIMSELREDRGDEPILKQRCLLVFINRTTLHKNHHSLPPTACKLQFAMKIYINIFETGSILRVQSPLTKFMYILHKTS